MIHLCLRQNIKCHLVVVVVVVVVVQHSIEFISNLSLSSLFFVVLSGFAVGDVIMCRNNQGNPHNHIYPGMA